ncbi:MAG TPA: hypothetical protein VMT58_00345 [Candidatus Binataceae bacterium]|nr:hypothetical protein [Candidatus Binataceae bacterium]
MAFSSHDTSQDNWTDYLRDLVRLPIRQFVVDSDLPLDEAVQRLRAITDVGWRGDLLQDDKLFHPHLNLFEGEITTDDFCLKRLTGYNTRLSPIVIGKFISQPPPLRVEVIIRLLPASAAFRIVWFWGFAGAFIYISATRPGTSLSPTSNPLATLLVLMALVGYVAAFSGFGAEARRTRTILEQALQRIPSPIVGESLAGVPQARSQLTPAGALGLCLFCLAIAAVLFGLQPRLIANNEFYKAAKDFIRANSAVQDELGAIVDLRPYQWTCTRFSGLARDLVMARRREKLSSP